MGYLRWFTMLALLPVLVACGSTGTSSPGLAPTGSDPDGRTFVVTGATEAGRSRSLVPGSEIRLRFDGDRLVVTAGCNTMSGAFRVEGTRLTVNALASTEMGCAPKLMAQDTWVAGLFDRPGQLTTGNDAAFISGDVVLALADRRTVSPDKPLVGTRWVLDGIVSGDSASSVPDGLAASFRITKDGEVLVDDSCNSGDGPVQVSGDRIVWGDRSTTLVGCLGPGSEQVQTAIRDVLSGATTYSIEEKSLRVTQGARSLAFRAAAKQPGAR